MIRMNPHALCRNERFQGNRCISVQPNSFLWGSVHFHDYVDSCRNDEKEKLGTCSSEVECVSSTTANLGGGAGTRGCRTELPHPPPSGPWPPRGPRDFGGHLLGTSPRAFPVMLACSPFPFVPRSGSFLSPGLWGHRCIDVAHINYADEGLRVVKVVTSRKECCLARHHFLSEGVLCCREERPRPSEVRHAVTIQNLQDHNQMEFHELHGNHGFSMNSMIP